MLLSRRRRGRRRVAIASLAPDDWCWPATALAPYGLREEAMATNFTVNGKPATTNAPPATPLLWVIREDLKLTGTKFGCGTGLCGACMVHVDGRRAFSCQTQVSEIAGRTVTTIEGLSPDSSPSSAESLAHRARTAMWLLPVRSDYERGRSASAETAAHPGGDRRAYERKHLPLRHLPADRARG